MSQQQTPVQSHLHQQLGMHHKSRSIAAALGLSALTGLGGMYASAYGVSERLPLIYGEPKLVDLQPGVGTRSHLVQVHSPDRVRLNHQTVVWISPLDDAGLVRLNRVYPYAQISPGLTRDVELDVGGANDLNARYKAQVCDVSGEAMQRVSVYLIARAEQGATWQRLRTKGIDIAGYTEDFSCPKEAAAVLTRTS